MRISQNQNVPFKISSANTSKIQTIFFLLTLHLGSFVTGYIMVLYNKSAYPKALTSLNIDSTCQENCQRDSYVLLTSTLPIGAIFGLFFSVPITYFFGRRKTIIFSDFLSILAFIVIRPFDFMLTTLFARFIFGLFCGINFSIIPVYANEILKKSLLSQDNSILFQVFFNFGVFFGFFGFEIMTDLYIILAFCLFRCVLFLFFMKFESPSFLARKTSSNLDNLKSVEDRLEEFEFPSLYSKNFELLDVFLSPFGINLFLAILMLIFYNFSGISFFLFYSSQISELNSTIVSGLNFFFSISSFFFIKVVKNQRNILFFTSPLNLLILLLMYCGIGRNSEFGVNFIHILMCFGLQFSFGTVTLPIIVKILPDIGVFLSGLGFWGMALFVSLCVNLKDGNLYYGEDIVFLVFLILAFLIYLILFRFLKESKLHSI